ncbi:MAG: hypothetical protein QF632_06640 [Candidatus Woesearchaeota archaeon]|nr:hypothetical protein [Candidatus Woesearchaeota archaeon]
MIESLLTNVRWERRILPIGLLFGITADYTWDTFEKLTDAMHTANTHQTSRTNGMSDDGSSGSGDDPEPTNLDDGLEYEPVEPDASPQEALVDFLDSLQKNDISSI